MKIEVLYWSGCPSTDEALELVDQVFAGRDAEVVVREVRTQEEAESLHFPGSPTILVDGEDVDPDGSRVRARLACRIYHVDGRPSPVPSRAQLEAALR